MAEKFDDIIDEDDRFSVADKKLSKSERVLPDISVEKPKEPSKVRVSSSVSLPKYVWSQLRRKSGELEEPYNILILKGLREIGFEVDDEDLIDQRKLRYQK